MSSGERSNDIQSAVEARTEKLAREAAEQAEITASEILGRNLDLVSPATALAIINREAERAAEEVRLARTLGHANDPRSEAPGLTVLFTRSGYERLRRVAIEEADSAPYVAQYVNNMQPTDEEGTAYLLTLPGGVYSMGWGECQFYGEATFLDGEQAGRKDPFSVRYGSIVRIEGDSGELWQNVKFTPEGVVREQ